MTGRIAFLCAYALASAFSAVAAEPVIRFAAEQVVCENLTPGAEVVYFSLSKERHGLETHLVERSAMLVDEDRDRQVVIPMPEGVPLTSMWVAVDLGTGHVGASAPYGTGPRHASLIRAPLVAQGQPGMVELDIPFANPINLFIARPGVGAWLGYVGDGASDDLDGVGNGVIQADLGSMVPLEPEMGELGELQARDIVVAADNVTMKVSIERVVGQSQ